MSRSRQLNLLDAPPHRAMDSIKHGSRRHTVISEKLENLSEPACPKERGNFGNALCAIFQKFCLNH